MNNLHTPTYRRMWNIEFSLLIVAEMLLCTACYMVMPLLPYRLIANHQADTLWAGLTTVAFVAGICASGLFGCWLIQRYRRNKVFLVSTLILGGTIMGLSAFDHSEYMHIGIQHSYTLMGVCALGGMAFGQAKRVLSCTLLIDKTESCNRTEANYAAIWTARLAIMAGLAASIMLCGQMGNTSFYGIAAITALVAAGLVMTVKFPFRAPEECTHIISTDRFFLPQGWNIAIVVALTGGALGVLIATHTTLTFITALACGFAASIAALHYTAIRNGRYTSAIGNTLIIISVCLMMVPSAMEYHVATYVALGTGFGLTNSEQLYKLLDCCDHCQRSTAESTYFLASDGGLFLGVAACLLYGACSNGQTLQGELCAAVLFAVAAIICSINAMTKKRRKEYHA